MLYCRIDDIQDNSIRRHGIPVAHSIYGVASTINAANYLLPKGLKRVQSLNHPEAITVCTEQLLELYYGQGMHIFGVITTPVLRLRNTSRSIREVRTVQKYEYDLTVPVSLCILLRDFLFVHFSAVMFSTAIIIRSQKWKKRFSDQAFFTTVNQVNRCNM
jgi:hypothetical protein